MYRDTAAIVSRLHKI